MSRPALLLAALLAAFALAQTLIIHGPSGNFTATVRNNTLTADGDRLPLPNVRLGWYFNGSFTVFGIYYGNPDCNLGTYPNAPRFYISCTAGTDMVVVAVKDPKAKITCRDKNKLLNPTQATQHVEIYSTKSLSIECESAFSAVVSTPTALIGALAGMTVASAVLVLAMGVLLLRRALLKQ